MEDSRGGRDPMTPGSRGSRESRDQSDDAAFQFGTQNVSRSPGVSITKISTVVDQTADFPQLRSEPKTQLNTFQGFIYFPRSHPRARTPLIDARLQSFTTPFGIVSRSNTHSQLGSKTVEECPTETF